jgi:hypothetical protein
MSTYGTGTRLEMVRFLPHSADNKLILQLYRVVGSWMTSTSEFEQMEIWPQLMFSAL